jgi:hypothetical protein
VAKALPSFDLPSVVWMAPFPVGPSVVWTPPFGVGPQVVQRQPFQFLARRLFLQSRRS